MERDKAIRLLERLRDETRTLREKNASHEDFEYWRQQVETILQEIFGSDAEELQEFRQIRFEPDMERWFKTLEKKGISRSSISTADGLQRSFEQRLYHADDFLLACIVGLRRPSESS